MYSGFCFILNSALRSVEHERCYVYVTPSSVLAKHEDKKRRQTGDISIPKFQLTEQPASSSYAKYFLHSSTNNSPHKAKLPSSSTKTAGLSDELTHFRCTLLFKHTTHTHTHKHTSTHFRSVACQVSNRSTRKP